MRRKTSDFQRMQKDWGVLQYGTEAVDAARVERINRKFDDILIYLADGILPEWQKIDCLETYFAKERRQKIQETYEEVCRFMRYYHGLAKKTERQTTEGPG